ncbi:TIGR01777 family oxidoreductase [Abyssalbus ytuae]|uniref:TIGR01777 family oxidoreductase n=1 Tax=Abyssalbus ytuae TaxID=2926907 RepID=A0A9E6ZP64_9FLAO|nr:TIGR01777 family oxidoreductase [Abyssalbus ytuae]UOB18319.1 TIGR01777 family oxidoreductase [Abyssalbus ytuae]
MRILITGATGLIGQEIVKQCYEKGYSVNYLSRSKDKLQTKENYKGFYWNPSKGEIDRACIKGVDAIINLAGSPISQRWTSKNKEKIINSRVNSSDLLYTLLEQENITLKSIVSASAVGIYPNSLNNYYDEHDNETDHSFLGEVVEKWEMATDNLHKFTENLARVRVGLVLSEKGGMLPQITKPVKLYAGSVFGNGEQWQSWIHIEDIAHIFLYAVENKLAGIYNGVAPNPVTHKKMIKLIAGKLKKPLILPNIPEPLMKIILGEMAYLLYVSQRVSSDKIEEKGYTFKYSNINLALDNLLNKKPA